MCNNFKVLVPFYKKTISFQKSAIPVLKENTSTTSRDVWHIIQGLNSDSAGSAVLEGPEVLQIWSGKRYSSVPQRHREHAGAVEVDM